MVEWIFFNMAAALMLLFIGARIQSPAAVLAGLLASVGIAVTTHMTLEQAVSERRAERLAEKTRAAATVVDNSMRTLREIPETPAASTPGIATLAQCQTGPQSDAALARSDYLQLALVLSECLETHARTSANDFSTVSLEQHNNMLHNALEERDKDQRELALIRTVNTALSKTIQLRDAQYSQ